MKKKSPKKRNSPIKWIVLIVVILVVVIVAAVILMKIPTSGNNEVFVETESGSDLFVEIEESDSNMHIEVSSNLDDSESDDESDEGFVEEGAGSGYSGGGSGYRGSAIVDEEIEMAHIKFPYTIPNTNVQIVKINGMDGAFVEDGSDENVSNVAAAVIKNKDQKPIEYISVKLKQGNRVLEFNASDIKNGASAVVMESNKQAHKLGDYDGCNADVAWIDQLSMAESEIKVTENENGSLTVENISGKDIPCVRIFYKFYMDDVKAYVGGITYNAKINDLKKDTSIDISPSHYEAGFSEVVMVRTYDQAQ